MSKKFNDKTVILITIDALRADHLKSYGYTRNTAPYLEKYFERGMLFLNTFTNGPETPTSFSSIFTSILPFLDGGYSPLPLQKKIFPEILKEHGIKTYAIHSNPNLGRYFNYDRGFDIFLDGDRYNLENNSPKKLTVKQSFFVQLKKILKFQELFNKLMYRLRGFNKLKNIIRNKMPFLTDILLPFTTVAYNAPYVVNKTISFLSNYDSPLFLWVHFMDVHGPYNPPERNVLKFSKRNIPNTERESLYKDIYLNHKNYVIDSKVLNNMKLLYDAEINFVDESLGKLLKYIDTKFEKNCLIILTSDHGESFLEHGFLGHQGNVFDEVLKVPLLMIEKGAENSQIRKINDTIQLIDIAPTILDYYIIEKPENFQGNSIIPLIEGKPIKRSKYVITECYQKQGVMKRNHQEGDILLSIRTNDWKYIFNEEKNLEYLFDLKNDPGEKINLIEENESKLSEFRLIKDHHLHNIKDSDEKSKISKSIESLNLKKFNL